MKSREGFGSLLNQLQLTGYGAELGVATGSFSKTLLETSNLKILFSIDRWNDRHDYNQYLKASLTLFPFHERSVIIKLPFEEAIHLFANESFDFIYIDGYAHTGQDEGRTLHQWWPKVKPGGIFGGHDYDKAWPKTIEEVDKFAKLNNIKLKFTGEIAGQGGYPSWYCHKSNS